MKNFAWLVAILIIVCACSGKKPVDAKAPLRPVRIALVSDDEISRERTFTGTSQSTQESRMSFKINGTVIELPIQVGDQLKSGDLIARLSRSSYDLQVQQSEAGLAQAQANQRNAEASYNRVKGLYENNNASRNDLDVARANAESARAQVSSARKSLEIAQLNRSYTRLTATSDCTVASVDVDINENISSGTQIAKVNCGTGIEVKLGVPESLIAGIEPNMPAEVRFNAIPNRVFAAEVTEIGVASGNSSATFTVVAALQEADQAVRPGMAAEIVFNFKRRQSVAHVIPASSVIRDERGTFVYIAEPEGDGTAKIRRQAVDIGELTGNGIEVITGLTAGDQVVTAGTSVIREQQIVLLPRS